MAMVPARLFTKFGSILGTLHIPTKIVTNCFGNGTKWISRNLHLALVSGNPFHSIPETTVNFGQEKW